MYKLRGILLVYLVIIVRERILWWRYRKLELLALPCPPRSETLSLNGGGQIVIVIYCSFY